MNTTATRRQVRATLQNEAPKARVWAVRAGSTGTGRDLFDVYAATMDEARRNVMDWARETGSNRLTGGDFTVHAGQSTGPLQDNILADMPLAVTGWEWDEVTGPEVTVDAGTALLDATFLADDGAGMALLMVGGTLQEHPVAALLPRCECGNPFRLCHPGA